ncbi:hypothetical protein F4813DRAFT_94293 [Daldinia decipiens]|uniref:uncharacterized protein n=1 Tax=Daldinia decipiens TaxID=326647 RepID=UPI0020C52DC0|nr:uncharacterized protein F4813DRAFT_94293 [Daldinia decipiens]KAI1661966.1 hypothetical protein F4813DRAFT_94293 [Daldinia decipiens]
MADNLCGPSTAPKSLSRHFEQDRSLQQDRFASSAGPSSGVHDATQRFRSLNLGDNRFTSEFSEFQNASFIDLSPDVRNWNHNHQLVPYPSFGNDDAFSPIDRANVSTRPRVAAERFNTSSRTGAAAAAAFPTMPIMSTPVGPPTTTHVPNLIAQRRTDWANEFNQRMAGRNFNQMNQSFGPPGQAFRPTNIYDENMLRQRMAIRPDQVPGFKDDLDFDAELRAWAAANSPETQAQANAWLRVEDASADSRVRNTQATTQSADSHQLTMQNLTALEQESVPAAEHTRSNLAESTAEMEKQAQSRGKEDSELAMAAQQILDSVSGDKSDKFKNSGFIQMMQKIAAQELVVRDNNLVESSQTIAN